MRWERAGSSNNFKEASATEQPQERLVGWMGPQSLRPRQQAMESHQVLVRDGHNSGPHFARITGDCGQDEP